MNAERLPEHDAAIPDIVHHLLDNSLAEELLRVYDSCNLECVEPDER